MNEMPHQQEDGPRVSNQAGLHMGVAMRGKMYALGGNHARALQYYRIAIRISVEAKDPELFFRHYLDCVMESLELTGALDDVLAYCDRAIALYAEKPPPNVLARMDLASIHQRKGVVLMKKKENKAARAELKAALDEARKANKPMPLAANVMRWLDSGFAVDIPRLVAEQKRTGYFNVRRENVDPGHAIELSDADLMAVARL